MSESYIDREILNILNYLKAGKNPEYSLEHSIRNALQDLSAIKFNPEEDETNLVAELRKLLSNQKYFKISNGEECAEYFIVMTPLAYNFLTCIIDCGKSTEIIIRCFKKKNNIFEKHISRKEIYLNVGFFINELIIVFDTLLRGSIYDSEDLKKHFQKSFPKQN